MLLLCKANAKLEGLSFFWESLDLMWLKGWESNGGKRQQKKKQKKLLHKRGSASWRLAALKINKLMGCHHWIDILEYVHILR